MWGIGKKRVTHEAKGISLNIRGQLASLAEVGSMGERRLVRVRIRRLWWISDRHLSFQQ